MTQDDVWTKFTPGIAQYVEALVRGGPLALSPRPAIVRDVCSGCTTSMTGPCADRFKVVIPYAGRSLTWEVLFDSQSPHHPPDFIFPQDDDFYPDITSLTHLTSWSAEQPESLSLVLKQLLTEYTYHQVSLVAAHSWLQFEYSTLMDSPEYSTQDIEVHLPQTTPGKGWLGPAQFLIRLHIDFSVIPHHLLPAASQREPHSATLLVSFHSPGGTQVSTQLYLSPAIEEVLGSSVSARLPSFPAGGYLIDYLPVVCQFVSQQVERVRRSWEQREEYVKAFTSLFSRMVVEYDSVDFSHITLLMEWHDFFFLLSIDLPGTFPADCPTFTFQSVYHEGSDGSPYTWSVRDYPYSPRWAPSQMALRAQSFVVEKIRTFQLGSVRDGSFR